MANERDVGKVSSCVENSLIKKSEYGPKKGPFEEICGVSQRSVLKQLSNLHEFSGVFHSFTRGNHPIMYLAVLISVYIMVSFTAKLKEYDP